MTITVANLQNTKEGIRCDRISMLGNPFVLESELDRKRIVEMFRQYLYGITMFDEEPSTMAAQLSDRYAMAISNTWKRPTHRQFIGELNRIQILSLTQDCTLLCWCSPLRCHCDILASYFKWKNQDSNA
jgi:Domain of unknown function (DUF4326)